MELSFRQNVPPPKTLIDIFNSYSNPNPILSLPLAYFVILSMAYKQNGSHLRQSPSSDSRLRIEDQRKLMRLWKEEQVLEDYQSMVLHYFDQFQGKQQLHHQILNELKKTYAHDSFYFKIDRLLQERTRTMDKMLKEARALERFKDQTYRREPNLEPICEMIDHVRKVHLLVSEEANEMFGMYGHPRVTKTGYAYLRLFKEFNDDLEFLKDSLMKYYMPFSPGFDPLFIELVQQLRKCYTNQSLVYDQNVEELINLNASYLYRLLRAQQRVIDYVSIAEEEKQGAMYNQQYQHYQGYSPKIDSLPAEKPHLNSPKISTLPAQKPKLRDKTQRFETKRQVQMEYFRSQTPKQPETPPPKYIPIPERIQVKIQQKPYLNSHINQQFPAYTRQQTQKILYEKMPQGIRSNKHSSLADYQQNQPTPIKTPRKILANSPSLVEMDPIQRIPLYRKPQKLTTSMQGSTSNNSYRRRAQTQQNTVTKNSRQTNRSPKIKSILPKLTESKAATTQKHADCLCRKRYKQKHLHLDQECAISQEQLQKRRKQIVKEIQSKYKALALKQMRHQLSKLGDPTYHRVRHLKHSRLSTIKARG